MNLSLKIASEFNECQKFSKYHIKNYSVLSVSAAISRHKVYTKVKLYYNDLFLLLLLLL